MDDPSLQSHRLTPVAGPTCWRGEELGGRTDWIIEVPPDAAVEIDTVARHLASRPLTDIRRDDAELPIVTPLIERFRWLLTDGPGIALMRGLPADGWDADQAAAALWVLGLQVGEPQPQDGGGAMLHHVRDTGERIEDNDDLRIYQTNQPQAFHNDGGDLFMLLCRRQAPIGGISRIVSATALFNGVLERDPAAAALLQQPFPFDARGQQRPGCPPVQRVPIFAWHAGRLHMLHKRPYIDLAQRFDDVGPLSTAQVAALDLLDELCDDPAMHHAFTMRPGDIIAADNFVSLHARDQFDDAADNQVNRDNGEGRHMLRLWLGLPDGPPLPPAYRDTREFGPLYEQFPARCSSR